MFLKNKKKSSFKNVDIWVLVTIFLFNIIFLNQNIVSDNDILKDGISEKIDQSCIIKNQDTVILQSFQIDNFETIYIDNLDWKSAKSLKCFGQILKVDTNNNTDPYFDLNSYEYKQRKSFIVQINYNPLIIYINLAMQLFMVLFLMFLTKTKNEHHYLILITLFFIYFRYVFFINKGFGSYGSTGVNPFEIKYDLFILFLLLFFKKQLTNQFLITLIMVFSLIKPSLLVFVILILFFKINLNFRFTPFQNFIFLSLPIIKEVIRFIASLSKKFDPIWLSSIQDPISGVQRYPDLWLTLGPLKCQSYENYSTFFYFSDFKFNCPSEFYSPIFKYVNFPFEVWSGIKVSSFLFLIIFIFLYFNFLNKYPQHKYLVSIFFLSPVLNFLFYEGNLDILTFAVACLALKNYRKNFILKSFLIFLVSLLEIHSVLILLGLILASILNKELKVIFTNFSFLVFFIIIVFADVGSSSIRSQFFTTSNYDLGSFENVGNPGVGYGFLLDFKQILIYISPNQYVQIFFSMTALFFITLFFVKNNKGNLNLVSKKLLNDNYYFYGYFLWFIITTMFSNQSYRLVNFLPFLFLLFIHSNKVIKLVVLLSITLTPSTQVFGNLFNSLEISTHRISLYTCLIVFMIIFVKNVFEKIEQTKDQNK